METSPTIKEIAKALAEFEGLQITVIKDATNPHFKSKFASLDNIIEAIRLPLSNKGLSFAQFPDGDGLTTILTHTSGEWMKATANLKLAKEDPQGQGSAYTYARRYALSAILGLATEDDDDAEATKAPQKAEEPRQATKGAELSATVKAAKKRIMELLVDIKGPEVVAYTKPAIADLIQSLTNLDPTDAGLIEIISRLETLKEIK